jgi:hypothetical protein
MTNATTYDILDNPTEPQSAAFGFHVASVGLALQRLVRAAMRRLTPPAVSPPDRCCPRR